MRRRPAQRAFLVEAPRVNGTGVIDRTKQELARNDAAHVRHLRHESRRDERMRGTPASRRGGIRSPDQHALRHCNAEADAVTGGNARHRVPRIYLDGTRGSSAGAAIRRTAERYPATAVASP